MRAVNQSDFATIVEWANKTGESKCLDERYPTRLDQCDEWMKTIQGNRHNQHFVISESNQRKIGVIELDHIAWRSGDAELRICIADDTRRGMGLGAEAIGAVVDYAFESLGLSRVYLRVYADNKRAIRCYKKCGFFKEGQLERTGTDGVVRRVILMTLCNDKKE